VIFPQSFLRASTGHDLRSLTDEAMMEIDSSGLPTQRLFLPLLGNHAKFSTDMVRGSGMTLTSP